MTKYVVCLKCKSSPVLVGHECPLCGHKAPKNQKKSTMNLEPRSASDRESEAREMRRIFRQ